MQPLWPLDCFIIATMATQTQQCSVSMFGSLGGHSLLSSATSSMRFAIRSFDHIWLLCRLVFIAFMLHHFGHLEACHSGSHSLFHRSKCQWIRQWAHLTTGLEAPEMKHPRPMTRLKATTWKKTPRPMTRMELLWMVPPVPMASGSTPWMGAHLDLTIYVEPPASHWSLACSRPGCHSWICLEKTRLRPFQACWVCGQPWIKSFHDIGPHRNQ